MAPNGTNATIPMPIEITADPSSNLKAPMDAVDSPPTDLAPATSSSSAAPQPQRPVVKSWNMKREMDRRKTYDSWGVPFMDHHRLSAAGFYYTNREDIVRCDFCGVEVGRWEEGDDPFRDHQRWSPSCGFVRGLPVGNVPISPNQAETQEPSRSMDVCGPFLEIRPNSGPERGMSNGVHHSMTVEELQKHGIHQSRGPMHPAHNTYEARMLSYESWPRSLKQKPDKLSEAGFYYTGKGDQTVCFHCGGGLKDWEETDDPWVEHAVWFPKCMHVVLIKGQDFIQEVLRLKEAKVPVQEMKNKLEDVQKAQASSSSAQSRSDISAVTSVQKEEKVIDDARVCQICFMEERGVLFLPCGHLVACVKCAPSLSTCAVCRQPFTGTVRAFIS